MSGRIRLLLAACGWLCAVACQAAPDFAAEPSSGDARFAAAWVLAGADNQDLPFAVVDNAMRGSMCSRPAAAWLGASAVLLGADPRRFLGRHRSRPGQPDAGGAHHARRPIRSRPGRNDKGEDIVWIDYASSLAIHRLRPAPLQERRPARLASPSPEDNRISAGCVIVPLAFYEAVVAPTLGSRPQRRLRAARIAPGARHVRGARPQPALNSACRSRRPPRSAVLQAGGEHAGDADRLVLVAGAAGRADAAEHRAGAVLDQHRAGLRQELALAPSRRG